MSTDRSLNSFPVVALDGGAASGKSSTARGVANQLDFLHVDTGSHYRALTLLLLQAGVDAVEGEKLDAFLTTLELNSQIKNHSAFFCANGEGLEDKALRSDAVNAGVSLYAALPSVRQRLLRYQRWHAELAQTSGFKGLVMEGRDIGSVVFPDAAYRFFLEADAETRAQRRESEGWVDSIQDRDRADSARKTAPLLCSPGAIRIDTGTRTLQEVIDMVCRSIQLGIDK